MVSGSPWSDPSTPTEQVPPYSGPPQQGPPYQGPPYQGAAYQGAAYQGAAYQGAPYQGQPYQGAPYGWPPAGGQPYPYASGWPAYPWPVAPQGPRRPGQVVAAAVLALVQAVMVLIGSLYTFVIAAMVGLASDQSLQVPAEVGRVANEARVLAIVQLASVVLLVVVGILALGNRPRPATWPLLLVAFGVQVALAIYWTVRLTMLTTDIPGNDNPGAAFLSVTLLFAASPLVGLGLVLIGPGRRWFARPDQPAVRYPGVG